MGKRTITLTLTDRQYDTLSEALRVQSTGAENSRDLVAAGLIERTSDALDAAWHTKRQTPIAPMIDPEDEDLLDVMTEAYAGWANADELGFDGTATGLMVRVATAIRTHQKGM